VNDGLKDDLDDELPVDEYRQISGLAVAAFSIGCLSIVATYSPMLWFVPVVGAVLAAVALRDLSTPGVVKVGRLAALGGLALSIGMGCQAVTRHVLGRRLVERRAVEVVDRWVTAIRQDRLLQARSMLTPRLRPIAGMVGDEENPKIFEDSFAEVNGFRRLPAVAAILGCGHKAVPRCEFAGYDEESQERKRAWNVRVRLAPCDGGREVVVRLELDMAYEPKPLLWGQNWEIVAVGLGDED
jgi:hypothetical protein